jgi:hypothetical protein
MAVEAIASRKPRRVCATASYLNAGLWGSRFVGECELATNGEKVWLKGRRVPVWMTLARVFGYTAFLPVGLYTGFLLGETLLGHAGYPPYYYLASALLTFLLVVLGLWGAGIWNGEVSSYESVVWAVHRGSIARAHAMPVGKRSAFWGFMNTFVHFNGAIQIEVPIGPGGKPRRLVLKSRGVDAATLMSVLSGVYYGQMNQRPPQPLEGSDPWDWSRN